MKKEVYLQILKYLKKKINNYLCYNLKEQNIKKLKKEE